MLSAEHLHNTCCSCSTHTRSCRCSNVQMLMHYQKRDGRKNARRLALAASREPRTPNEQWIAENFIPKINKTLFLFRVGRFFETVTVIESALWLNDYDSRLFICFGLRAVVATISVATFLCRFRNMNWIQWSEMSYSGKLNAIIRLCAAHADTATLHHHSPQIEYFTTYCNSHDAHKPTI